jgi:hypothetical protein
LYKHNNDYTTLFSFLLETPSSYTSFKNNYNHYKNNYKAKFELSILDFDIIIKQILKLNINYYSDCQNISFNDLLLYKNVKNFVCFTGTAYVKPPISLDINFNPSNYITFSKINDHKNVAKAITSIIRDVKRVHNFYINSHDVLIEDIFNCLNNYEILIDIGGIFIKYNINSFIEEYKNLPHRKEYIVYFDNGRKIYNLSTNQFANDDSINNTSETKKGNAFYYFSNNNITGVDAKNIMNPNAHGLITVTNKTNLRDFSQGIFRMRNILDTQTCDIIFNKKFKDIIMNGGCENFAEITETNIREIIIKNLKIQQKIIDKQKEKVLIKQNIFALNKESTNADTNKQILYLDPMSEPYDKSVRIFNEYIIKFEPIALKFDFDSLNIINKHSIWLNKPDHITKETLDKNSFLECLVNKYFIDKNDVIESKQNMVEEEVKEEKQVDDTVTDQIISIPYNYSNDSKGIIYSDFKYNENNRDQILVAYIFDSKESYGLSDLELYLDILLIYDNTNNNLVIIDINKVTNFLMYNENINERYTFIPFYNKSSYYGKIINDKLVKHLIRISLGVLNTIISKMKHTDKITSLSKLIQYLQINKYDDSFKFMRPPLELKFLKLFEGNQKIPQIEVALPLEEAGKDSYHIKYIKYKAKYLKLKNNIKNMH